MTEPPPTTGSLDPVRVHATGADARTVDGITVDVARWEALARAALAAEGAPPDAGVSLQVVSETEMAELNETHLGQPGPTDVLSFPLDLADHLARQDGPVPAGHLEEHGIPLLAGDIVLCPSVARRNAPTHAGTLDDELALLTVHGVLHLLGHDHAEPDERARMQARERALLGQLHGTVAGDPWATEQVTP